MGGVEGEGHAGGGVSVNGGAESKTILVPDRKLEEFISVFYYASVADQPPALDRRESTDLYVLLVELAAWRKNCATIPQATSQ